MKLIIFVFLNFLSPIIISAQDAKLSVGIEMGLIKNWSTKPVDEVGVFINSQDYKYTLKELFQKVYVGYESKESKYSIRVDFFRATYSDLICAKGNISFDPNARDCSGTDWNAYQINTNMYRKIFPFNERLFLNPSIGAGVMWYGNDSYSIGNSGSGSSRGSLFNYYYDHKNTNFRNTNIVLNSGIALGYKINPLFNLSVHYNYQQGIFKMYQIDIISWKPDDYEVYEPPIDQSKLMDVKYISRGSNSHFGFRVEFFLLSINKKNKK